MLAARLIAPRRYEIVEVPAPRRDDAGPDALVVSQEFGAVCGSDLPFFTGETGQGVMEYPLAPGLSLHECVGTVVDAGSAGAFREGERVLARPMGHLGLAERFLTRDAMCTPLPEGSDPSRVLLGQPLGTVLYGLRRVGSLIGRDAVVVGQGPIGLLFTAMLRRFGARRVIGVEPVGERRALAIHMGADAVLDPATDRVAECVAELTDGAMADLVVEAVGQKPATLDPCMSLARRRATVLLFGVPLAGSHGVCLERLFRREITLIASSMPEQETADFARAMEMIARGEFDPTPLVSHRLPFERAQEAFSLAVERTNGAVKIVLDFRAARHQGP